MPILFRSGWFLESVATGAGRAVRPADAAPVLPQPARAGCCWLPAASSALVTLAIPYSPLAGILGLAAASATLLLALAVITALYVLATEIAKQLFLRRISAEPRPVTATA